MAEHAPSGPAELGAPMDYDEHRRTFAGFVALTKVGILFTIGTVQALTLFGIAAHGFWLGVLMLLLLTVATIMSFATKGSINALIGVVIIGFVFMALTLG